MKLFVLPFDKDYLKNRISRLREEMQQADIEDIDEYFKILFDTIDLMDVDESTYLLNAWLNLSQAYAWFRLYSGVDIED